MPIVTNDQSALEANLSLLGEVAFSLVFAYLGDLGRLDE